MRLRTVVLVAASSIVLACATSPLGRKQLILMPDSQMDAMGTQAFQELKAQTPTVSDPSVTGYVRCVAGPLTEAAKGKASVDRWELAVFKDETANAFALPGGKIGVHTGLLKVARTDAQLAAVIGHEIGHVIARHGNERVSEAFATQGGLAAVSAIMGGQGASGSKNTVLGLLGLGAQVGVLLPHSRTQESEADLIGLDLMARAGFDPRESAELWRNMMKDAGGKAPPEFLSTHPASENRIRNLEANFKDAMPKYEAARAAGQAPKCAR
jgi:predicted Zn-dependent protease